MKVLETFTLPSWHQVLTIQHYVQRLQPYFEHHLQWLTLLLVISPPAVPHVPPFNKQKYIRLEVVRMNGTVFNATCSINVHSIRTQRNSKWTAACNLVQADMSRRWARVSYSDPFYHSLVENVC